MRRIVFDIETVSQDFDSFDEKSRQLLELYFKKYADTPEEIEEEKDKLSFSPLNAKVVAIGMLDADTERGACYFSHADNSIPEPFEENGVKFESGDEKAILQNFWHTAEFYDEFITFAGRMFDAPVLIIRSAIHGIRPGKNLMMNRYLNYQPANLRHIDLQDQFSFYGATRRDALGKLHFWCQAFGIASPKTGKVTGDDVTRIYREGGSGEIARYCMADVRATLELFRKWDQFLRF